MVSKLVHHSDMVWKYTADTLTQHIGLKHSMYIKKLPLQWQLFSQFKHDFNQCFCWFLNHSVNFLNNMFPLRKASASTSSSSGLSTRLSEQLNMRLMQSLFSRFWLWWTSSWQYERSMSFRCLLSMYRTIILRAGTYPPVSINKSSDQFSYSSQPINFTSGSGSICIPSMARTQSTIFDIQKFTRCLLTHIYANSYFTLTSLSQLCQISQS